MMYMDFCILQYNVIFACSAKIISIRQNIRNNLLSAWKIRLSPKGTVEVFCSEFGIICEYIVPQKQYGDLETDSFLHNLTSLLKIF